MTKSIHVRIDSELTWTRFKRFVENKHGKLHTVMGQELEKAILQYLDSQDSKKCVHTHTKVEPGTNVPKPVKSSSKVKFEAIKQRFLTETNDADEFQQFYAKRLVQQYMNVHDPRVVERYCSKLFDAWLLEL